jgi:hypothetical protein
VPLGAGGVAQQRLSTPREEWRVGIQSSGIGTARRTPV